MSTPQAKPQSALADLLPGTVLRAKYQIEKKVGGGGMAVVYRAVDTRTGIIWAIKEMRPQPGSMTNLDEAKKQFEHEAKLLSGLTHPNLPKVLECFEEDSRVYLVMEFIDGQTLDKYQATIGGVVPEQTVVGWAGQVCEVLTYLHAQEPPIIFRDLKPGNIMLTQAGVIKLIDFGIARTYKAGKQRDTMAMGSENYAPPEQWGKEQTNERSDIYALGATMYHLLTGKPPRIAFLPDPLESLCALNPNLSPGVEQVVLKAMAKDRRDRYRTSAEFGDVLRRMQPSNAQPYKVPPPSGAPCPNCCHPNRPQARFCGGCGASLLGPLTACLQVMGSSGAAWEMPIQKTPFLIGRSDGAQAGPDLDLSFYDSKYISRRHAEITQNGTDYILTDPGSANGTFVNGQQLAAQTPCALHNGDHVGIGTVQLVFRLGLSS